MVVHEHPELVVQLLHDLAVDWRHVDHVDQKVENLRNETRLEGRTVVPGLIASARA